VPSLCRENEMREYARYSSPTRTILIDPPSHSQHLQIRRATPATLVKINSFHLVTGGFLSGRVSKC
jgi:hypothetical protein